MIQHTRSQLFSTLFQGSLRPGLLGAGLCAALSMVTFGAAAAQEPAPPTEEDAQTLTLGEGAALIRLAFPKATFDASLLDSDQEIAREVEQTLRDDLDFTGVFNTQGPTELAVLSLTGERKHDFEQYQSLGNEVLLLTTIKRDEGRLAIEGRLYDLPSQQSITGKRFIGQLSLGRRLAHTMADAVYHQFTGLPGIALTQIAFQSNRDNAERQELYLMDYDGRNQRRISNHKSTSGFSDWSPTGDALAYMSYFSGVPGIHYVDIETSRKISVYQGGTLNLSPSFSADGTRIAFAHATEDNNVDIYVCERQCSSPRRLTSTESIDTNPAWSPDGQQIAFTSDRSGKPNIYVMGLDGKGLRRISYEGDYNDGACWRPDSTHLVYASRGRGFRFQIAETNLVDLTTKTLAKGTDSYEQPCYSPDGRRILFTVKRGREGQLHVMRADGSDWRQLTHEGSNSSGDWSGFVNP